MSDQVTQRYPILQAYFPWHKARVTFLSAFLLALMKVTTANLTKRANALNGKVKQKSNYRRIQRFFAEFKLPQDWATGLIRHRLPVKSDFILAMDRTQWSLGKVPINLLTRSVSRTACALRATCISCLNRGLNGLGDCAD